MRDSHQPEPEREVLSRDVSERLLGRAAELDALTRAGAEVTTLRAAAAEAGISPAAFDAALDELSKGGQTPAVHSSRWRPRVWGYALVASVLVLASGVTFSRLVPSPAAPLAEQAFVLRCLSTGEAAELLRPTLERTSTEVIVSPTRAPRILTVRGTPAEMQRVSTLLHQQDGAACVAPAPTIRP